MSNIEQRATCPVEGCETAFDEVYGLCWRHRQIVPVGITKAILKAHDAIERVIDCTEGRRVTQQLRQDWLANIRAATKHAEAWRANHASR